MARLHFESPTPRALRAKNTVLRTSLLVTLPVTILAAAVTAAVGCGSEDVSSTFSDAVDGGGGSEASIEGVRSSYDDFPATPIVEAPAPANAPDLFASAATSPSG